MDGYDVCIRACVAADVRTIFTLMSEDVMGLVSRCRSDWDEEMSVIDARHEGNAVAMADAYARATDGVGVCVVGRGPSVAQTGTALTTARKAGSSLLVLTAESALDRQTEDKNFDQQGYLESTVGEVVSIRAVDSLPERMTDVLRRLRGGDGPIAVQIPNDVLNGAIQGVPGDWLPTERVTPPTQEGASLSPEPERIDEIVIGNVTEEAREHIDALIAHMDDELQSIELEEDSAELEGSRSGASDPSVALTDGAGRTVRSILAETFPADPEEVADYLRSGDPVDRLNEAVDVIEASEEVSKSEAYGRIVFVRPAYRYRLTDQAMDLV